MKFTELEQKALTAWQDCGEDFGFLSFAAVAQRSGLERHRVRRVVRSLARKGIVQFQRGLWTDDGEMYGSGYGLTPAGRLALPQGSDHDK